MKSTTSSASSGIGFGGALTLLFVGLKLTNLIDWSWWWVLSPLWIAPLIFVVVVLFVLLIATVVTFLKR